jgi:hypothetical protein
VFRARTTEWGALAWCSPLRYEGFDDRSLGFPKENRVMAATVTTMTAPIVEGVSCEHCEQTVEDALRGVAGDALVRAVEDADDTVSA